MSAQRIPTFYTPLMVARVSSYSPSAFKPTVMAEALALSSLPVSILEPLPVSEADFCRVHSPRFVKGVLSGQFFNGFGDQEPSVARSLPYTSGAMLSAARAARPDMPAAALCSGFHHAGYSTCHGFCTFNGLMVTAAALLEEGFIQRIAIVDADMHVGDGTDDILGLLDDLSERVLHLSLGRRHHTPDHAEAYLETMRGLEEVFRQDRPDLILYQAGADPHVNDPLGGVLSSDQLRERDRILFRIARDQGLPVAWNLAGGYQRTETLGIDPVIAIHLATFEEAVRVYMCP